MAIPPSVTEGRALTRGERQTLVDRLYALWTGAVALLDTDGCDPDEAEAMRDDAEECLVALGVDRPVEGDDLTMPRCPRCGRADCAGAEDRGESCVEGLENIDVAPPTGTGGTIIEADERVTQVEFPLSDILGWVAPTPLPKRRVARRRSVDAPHTDLPDLELELGL